MEPSNKSNEISKKQQIHLKNIRSKVTLKKIFNFLKRNILLQMLKYNKNEQKNFNLNLKDYIEYAILYSDIVIEVIPVKKSSGKFINIVNKSEKKYFSIYFNDSYRKINRDKLNEKDKIKKIKIIIDYKVKSLNNLFGGCKCIESISFKKFYRININNMSYMFSGCSSLKELNLTNFNTSNVTNMSNMFFDCPLLERINLSNFNTNNVTNMKSMFNLCSSLTEIDISHFNTNKVKNMESMFAGCSSLESLSVSNFSTEKLENTANMFNGCQSLKDLKLPEFEENNKIKMNNMFSNCPISLMLQIKNKHKNIKPEALIVI